MKKEPKNKHFIRRIIKVKIGEITKDESVISTCYCDLNFDHIEVKNGR